MLFRVCSRGNRDTGGESTGRILQLILPVFSSADPKLLKNPPYFCDHPRSSSLHWDLGISATPESPSLSLGTYRTVYIGHRRAHSVSRASIFSRSSRLAGTSGLMPRLCLPSRSLGTNQDRVTPIYFGYPRCLGLPYSSAPSSDKRFLLFIRVRPVSTGTSGSRPRLSLPA